MPILVGKHLVVALWRYAKLIQQILLSPVLFNLAWVIFIPFNLETPAMVTPAGTIQLLAIFARLLWLTKIVVPILWPAPEVAL